jgi:hypothetical protein
LSDRNPGAYTLDSKPYGISYEDWTIKFWQWLISIPADRSPVTDQTGERCGEEQGNLPVFFLSFSFSGGAQRTCTIPTEKAILIPVNVVEVSSAEFPSAQNDEDLHRLAEEDESSNPFLFLSVDRKEFQDLEKYRVHSRAFDVNFPDNPIFGQQSGKSRAVSDGYWVIHKPLPPGKHDIHFKARLTNPNASTASYSDDLKYTINVS